MANDWRSVSICNLKSSEMSERSVIPSKILSAFEQTSVISLKSPISDLLYIERKRLPTSSSEKRLTYMASLNFLPFTNMRARKIQASSACAMAIRSNWF